MKRKSGRCEEGCMDGKGPWVCVICAGCPEGLLLSVPQSFGNSPVPWEACVWDLAHW